MTTRIYKNEFDKNYIQYLKKTYKVEEESEKVLTLGDITPEDDDKFHSAMFKSYDELCAMFPETFTKFTDELKKLSEELHKVYGDLLDRIVLFQSLPAWNAIDFSSKEENEAFDQYDAIQSTIKTLGFLTK